MVALPGPYSPDPKWVPPSPPEFSKVPIIQINTIWGGGLAHSLARGSTSPPSLARPHSLLAASEHMYNGAPGALWTRFTVSYNLYAGSVVVSSKLN